MTRASRLGIVAGSGIELEELLDDVTCARSFGEIPGLCETDIAGHAGRIVEGTCAGIPVVLQSGRLHLYEGHSIETVSKCVDIMHGLGVETVLYTNAAGGLVPDMMAGELMAISHIALWPYGDWEGEPDRLELDFDLEACARRGTYMWVHGPCYETRAEIAALRSLGVEAVGMSTAPEVVRCHELGMRAGAVSCITNTCGTPEVLTHERVVETARSASARLREVIRGWLQASPTGARV